MTDEEHSARVPADRRDDDGPAWRIYEDVLHTVADVVLVLALVPAAGVVLAGLVALFIGQLWPLWLVAPVVLIAVSLTVRARATRLTLRRERGHSPG